MRRSRRELRVFNLSMLDVMSSALGAVLVLFALVSVDARTQGEAAARTEARLERVTAEMARAAADLRQRADDVEQARARAAAAEDALDDAQRACPPVGLAIGMCRVAGPTVRIRVYDHRQIDGDRVDLELNGAVVARDVALAEEVAAQTYSLSLEPGANYLVARALTEGTDPPNTATVVISPCIDGRAEVFRWDMTLGQQRHVSIVREPSSR